MALQASTRIQIFNIDGATVMLGLIMCHLLSSQPHESSISILKHNSFMSAGKHEENAIVE